MKFINYLKDKLPFHFQNKTWLLVCLMGLSLQGFSQSVQVSGIVSDSGTGEPLIGAIVQEAGTSNGAVTDLNGSYTISVSSGSANLDVSYLGYVKQSIAVNNQTSINIGLNLDQNQIEEVVVIDYGYGTIKKEDLTGAVASITAKELSEVPASSTMDALAGRLPGVNIQTADGEPGAAVSVRVRGGNSITQSNEPIYVVDGFIVGGIDDIPPNDIESINVLKDAAATAIYGSRASNGVIVVRTKNAREGKMTVAYNNFFKFNNLPKDRKYKVLSPYEYVLANYEVARLRSDADVRNFERYFGSYNDLELYKYQRGTDWQDELFGDSRLSQFHNISLTGGTEMTKMRGSLSYNGDEGLLTGSAHERTALNFKIDQKLSDKLSLDGNARITRRIIDGAGTSNNAQLDIKDAVQTRPVNGIVDQIEIDPNQVNDDNDYQQFIKSLISPTELVKQDWRKRTYDDYVFGVGLNWDVIDNLKFRSQYNTSRGFRDYLRFYGPLTSESFNYGSNLPLGQIEENKSNGYRLVNTLNYKYTPSEEHDFAFLLGQEVSSSGGTSSFIRAKEFRESITPEELFANIALGTLERVTTTENTETNYLSFFSRIDYKFMDKLVTTFTVRADQSSRFTKANNLGIFPAIAVAWKMEEENFLANSESIDQLKLRLSYGATGNDGIPTNAKSNYFSATTLRGPGFNNVDNVFYTSQSTLGNSKLKWETTTNRNIGLDYSFFEAKVFGSLDFYKNTTDDLLLRAPISPNSGYDYQYKNVGGTSNKGVELGLTGYMVEKDDFTLSGRMNFGINRLKIDYLTEGVDELIVRSNWASTDLNNINDYYARAGGPIGDIYGYVTEGMYTVDDFQSYDQATGRYILKDGVPNSTAAVGNTNIRPGFLKLKDLNGDGLINADDRTVIGNALPDYQGGFGFNSTFKNFDANIFLNFQVGNDVYNTGKIQYNQFRRITYGNLTDRMNSDNRFTYIDVDGSYTGVPGGVITDLAQLAELNANKTMWSQASFGVAQATIHSWAVEDGSFLRLNNLGLGYTLPSEITSKVGIDKCRFYVNGQNLHIWTKYSGYDPEVSTNSNTLAPGVDDSSFPRSRSYTFGLNLTF